MKVRGGYTVEEGGTRPAPPTTGSGVASPIEKWIEADTLRLLKLVNADIIDWFTLPPRYRTKERLLKMVRETMTRSNGC